MKRRSFVQQSTLAGLGLISLQTYLQSCATPKHAYTNQAKLHPGYGPLKWDPKGILNLPKGFSYQIISRAGSPMNDGFRVPGRFDGMGTFKAKDDKIIVIRNHELSPGNIEDGAFGENLELIKRISRDKFYDYGSGQRPSLGGTTTFVYNPKTQQIEKEYMSLIGTNRNCSGGVTPWNTWLSCEEDVSIPDARFEKYHGYIFEVPASEEVGLINPKPLLALGRFNHEAVAIHPITGIVYLTEDRDDSLFYRFIPNHYGKLDQGGELQALQLKESKYFDTRNWHESGMTMNTRYEVEWQAINGLNNQKDDLRFRGYANGATRFARGEGNFYTNGQILFTCTSGGKKQLGQVFKYAPSPFEGRPKEKERPPTLELFVESTSERILRNCDNFTVSTLGDLIICEDRPDARLIGVTPEGGIYHFAKNVGYRSELTGVTFSPDGQVMFVNIQSPGLTLAITGPWESRIPSDHGQEELSMPEVM